MIAYIDCQAQTIASNGYLALAAPGSSASLLLTTLLTMFIALYGYRMLFGYVPTIRDGVFAFVKIGIVLTFASSWPTFQTVIYNVVIHAPAQLASEIGGASGLPGASGGLAARLDAVDLALKNLSIFGVGAPALDPISGRPPDGVAPPLFNGFDTFAMGGTRVLFLIGSVGAFAILHLAAGVLLALGPIFFGFLLFDGTRTLFLGWLRALIGIVLGGLSTVILLGIELALLEPWLSSLLTLRVADAAISGMPAILLASAIIFLVALSGTLLIVSRIASALAFPSMNTVHRYEQRSGTTAGIRAEGQMHTSGAPAIEVRSRAAAIASSIGAMQRREDAGDHGNHAGSVTSTMMNDREVRSPVAHNANRLVPRSGRRSQFRSSAGHRARDRTL